MAEDFRVRLERNATRMKLWREHGGDQHGPRVEHVDMPLANFHGFLDALVEVESLTKTAAEKAALDMLAALKAWEAHVQKVFNAQMRGKLDDLPLDCFNRIEDAFRAAIAKAEPVR